MASTSTATLGVGGLTVTLPTKRHDHDGDKNKNVVGETKQDAFSRYSNDLLRLKAILLFDEDEDDADAGDQADDDLDSLATINRALSSVGLRNLHLNQGQGRDNGDISKRRRGNHSRPLQQSNQRKTRLSWEAHPSLLLHDMLSELDDLDHDHCVSDEDEDDQTEKSIQENVTSKRKDSWCGDGELVRQTSEE